jgi:hypothetical protein
MYTMLPFCQSASLPDFFLNLSTGGDEEKVKRGYEILGTGGQSIYLKNDATI